MHCMPSLCGAYFMISFLLHTSATSMSRIRIDGDQLVIGENTIRLTVTGERGTQRVFILTVERIAGERAVKIGATSIVVFLLCLTSLNNLFQTSYINSLWCVPITSRYIYTFLSISHYASTTIMHSCLLACELLCCARWRGCGRVLYNSWK